MKQLQVYNIRMQYICMYCEIITISQVNIHLKYSYNFFFLRGWKIYSPSKFWIYNIILLTIVTMLNSTFSGIIYNWKFAPFDTFTHFANPTPIYSLNLWTPFWKKIPYISNIKCYFSFSDISLSIMLSRSIHVIARFPSFYGWIILHCICVPHFLYPSILQWTLRIFPYLGYCKWCWNEHIYLFKLMFLCSLDK